MWTFQQVYRHPNCLVKHRWEHSPHWREASKFLLSKHQQVQMLEVRILHLCPQFVPDGGCSLYRLPLFCRIFHPRKMASELAFRKTVLCGLPISLVDFYPLPAVQYPRLLPRKYLSHQTRRYTVSASNLCRLRPWMTKTTTIQL